MVVFYYKGIIVMNKTTIYFLSLLSVPLTLFGMEEGAASSPVIDKAALFAVRQEIEQARQQAAAAHERRQDKDPFVAQLAQLDEEDAQIREYEARSRAYYIIYPKSDDFSAMLTIGPKPAFMNDWTENTELNRRLHKARLERFIARRAHD